MRVTVSQIAKAAGVSTPTVSLVLNNKGERYSAETRKRVLRIAEELGYRPNASARDVATGRCNAIGVLTGMYAPTSVVQRSLPGIHAATRERNLHLVLAELPDQKLTDSGFVPRIMSEYAVSGFLISYTHNIPARMVELIEHYKIPSVWLNTRRDEDCVHPADYQAGLDATRRLIEMGHQRIGYFTMSHTAHYSHEDRYRGYVDAMKAARLQPIDLRTLDWVAMSSRGEAPAWFIEDRPTALLCYGSDDTATINHWALKHAVSIPDDVSVAVFHDERAFAGPRGFDTHVIPFEAVGRAAVEMLLEKIEKGGTIPSQSMPFTFQDAASCAAPRRQRRGC